jgi:hypothetical protein
VDFGVGTMLLSMLGTMLLSMLGTMLLSMLGTMLLQHIQCREGEGEGLSGGMRLPGHGTSRATAGYMSDVHGRVH